MRNTTIPRGVAGLAIAGLIAGSSAMLAPAAYASEADASVVEATDDAEAAAAAAEEEERKRLEEEERKRIEEEERKRAE